MWVSYGKRHIDAIRRIPGVQLAAVVDFNLNYAKKMAEENDTGYAFAAVEEMLKKGDVDIVHNCAFANCTFLSAKR